MKTFSFFASGCSCVFCRGLGGGGLGGGGLGGGGRGVVLKITPPQKTKSVNLDKNKQK
jgi:hypothetical protein